MSHRQSLLGGVKPGLPLIENGHHLNPSAVSYSERFIDDTNQDTHILYEELLSTMPAILWHSGLKNLVFPYLHSLTKANHPKIT